MHARLLVTSHGRNRQHVQFELAQPPERNKGCVLFTHTWTWAHQKRRPDPEYDSGTILTIWAV